MPADQVLGVVVDVLSPTSVNVSWVRLDSDDIAGYLVYYSLMGGGGRRRQDGQERVEFPGDVGSGEVDRLQPGTEYSFQVTATVLVSGMTVEGQQRSDINMDSIATLEAAGMVGVWPGSNGE